MRPSAGQTTVSRTPENTTAVHRHVPRICPRGGGLRGPRLPRKQIKNSLDLTNYFYTGVEVQQRKIKRKQIRHDGPISYLRRIIIGLRAQPWNRRAFKPRRAHARPESQYQGWKAHAGLFWAQHRSRMANLVSSEHLSGPIHDLKCPLHI